MSSIVKIDLPISKILFRTNEISGAEECLCPKCLTFNERTAKECTYCHLQAIKYDEKLFWSLREKFLDEGKDKSSEVGIASQQITEKGVHLEKMFIDQLNQWQPIFQMAQFINKYSMTKLKMEYFGLVLLSLFPLPTERLNQLKTLEFDFDLKNENFSLIADKLLLIEKKSVIDILANFAFTVQNFMKDVEGATAIKNLEWLNIVKEYYFYNNVLIHTKDTEVELQKSKQAIFAIKGMYDTEIAFFPLHWKYLVREKTKSIEAKDLISKKRYQFLLELLTPQNKAEKALQKLGLAYCSGDMAMQSDLNIKTYYDEQLLLPFSERDNNFLISHMIVFSSPTEKVMCFQEKFDSYFIPLINYIDDMSQVEQFFLKSDNVESLVRGVLYFDFTKTPNSIKPIVERLLAICSDEMIEDLITKVPDTVKNEMFTRLIQTDKTNLVDCFFKKTNFSWPANLSKTLLVNLPEKNINVLIQNMSSIENLEAQDWFSVAFNNERSASFLKECLYQLRRNFSNKIRPWPLLKFWFESETSNQTEKSNLLFDELGMFIGGSVQLNLNSIKEKFFDDDKLFLNFLWDKLASSDAKDNNLVIQFLARYVDNRGTSLDFFQDKTSEQIIPVLIKSLIMTNENNTAAILLDLIRALFVNNKISEDQILLLWDQYVNIKNSDIRNDLEQILKRQECIKKLIASETAPSIEDAEKQKAEEEKKALKLEKELAAANRKLEQEEQKRKMIEERDRMIAEAQQKAQLKNQQYQIKMSEMQMWYQLEMSKIMMSQEGPMEKSAKMTVLAAEYQKKQMELSMWMSSNN